MKKLFKIRRVKDILINLIFVITYIVIFLITTHNGKYIMGSKMDFSMQHYLIPEYFRKLFYSTHNLLPDFAFNLGAGQNIYNFSYYGLLSPIILLSYLFPMIKMLDFTIIVMGLIVLISTSLFYFYLRKNNYSYIVSFLASFMFLCASPIIFHTHRHIMFVNYFPFLIIGFYGVDKYINNHKSWLLMLSITLMIFTSYYYSISGMIVLIILGIYKYLKNKKSTFKEFVNFLFKYALRFIIPILIGGVLIIPTLYSLLHGRNSTVSTLSLLSLIKPKVSLLYGNYTIGLTLISFVSIVAMLFSKKIENKFLSLLLLLISTLPIFSYILNGFLYADAKVLIPFIPLVLIIVSEFLDWLLPKLNKWQILLGLYVIASSLIVCISVNLKDNLILKTDIDNKFYQDYSNVVSNLTNNSYRINTSLVDRTYINKVGDINEYKTTMYSSAYNKDYDYVFEELFNNPLPYRNEFMSSSDNNILFQMYMGEKYIASKYDYQNVYRKINVIDNVNIYENDFVLPIGYATSKVISQDNFDALEYPDNILNLLGRVVIDEKTNTSIITSSTEDLSYTISNVSNLEYNKTDYGYYIDSKKNGIISLDINQDLSNKILIITFDILENNTCKSNDLAITINDIKNTLTCSTWKYYNRNTNFNYVLADNQKLNIIFSKGKYKIGNIKVNSIDVDMLKNINSMIDPFVINSNKTKGDIIEGNIDVKENGYFTISIPFDKGFNIYVDNQKQEYYKVNGGFIGFDITKGNHNIKIEYKAPFKSIGLVISIIGICSLIGLIFYETRKRKS